MNRRQRRKKFKQICKYYINKINSKSEQGTRFKFIFDSGTRHQGAYLQLIKTVEDQDHRTTSVYGIELSNEAINVAADYESVDQFQFNVMNSFINRFINGQLNWKIGKHLEVKR